MDGEIYPSSTIAMASDGFSRAVRHSSPLAEQMGEALWTTYRASLNHSRTNFVFLSHLLQLPLFLTHPGPSYRGGMLY